MNVTKRLGDRAGIVAWAGDRWRHDVDARWRELIVSDWSNAFRRTLQLGTWPPHGAAHHVPDNHAIHALPSLDDVRTDSCVDARPRIEPWVPTYIHAKTPDDELLGMWWPLVDGGIVTIQTTLQFDHRNPITWQSNGIVMPVGFAR